MSTASADAGPRRLGALLERAFVFAAISIYAGAYIGIGARLDDTDFMGGETDSANATAMAVLLAGILGLSALRWREVLFAARHGGAVNVMLVLALASVAWSADPALSLRRFLVLLQTVLLAYYMAARFPVATTIRLWAAALLTALVASLIAAIAVPEVGVMSRPGLEGAWQGVFTHKSMLGICTVLCALCLGWLATQGGRGRAIFIGGLVLCVMLAVLARSRTAQLSILLMLGIACYLPLLRARGIGRAWAGFGLAVAVLTIGTILFLFFVEIMTALGKDPSLTGRVPLWTALLELASARPLGYGYAGFWVVGSPDVEYVWRRTGWLMQVAHNGYLEVLMQLGLPGLLVMIWAFAQAIRSALRAWITRSVRWAGFAATYLLALSLASLMEAFVFRAGDIQNVMFVFVVTSLRLAEARHAASLPAPGFRTQAPRDRLYGRDLPA